jgi:hypothetical protein
MTYSNLSYVLNKINYAFCNVCLEDGVSISEANVIDDYGTINERKKARKNDELLNWHLIPEEQISYYDGCLCFMDFKGYRFHLPAYMTFSLKYYKTSSSSSIEAPFFSFSHSHDFIDAFSVNQKSACIHYAKYMVHNTNIFDLESDLKTLNELCKKCFS